MGVREAAGVWEGRARGDPRTADKPRVRWRSRDRGGGLATPLTRHLRGSLSLSRPLSHDALRLLKAAFHTFVPDERVLEGSGGLTGKTTAQIGLYAHRCQDNRGLVIDPGCRTPATPPPAGFFPPLLREGVAAERICTGRPRYAIAGDQDLKATLQLRRSEQRWMGPQVDVKWEGDRTREDKETTWPTRLHAHVAGMPTRRRTDSADGAVPPWEPAAISWRVGKVTQR